MNLVLAVCVLFSAQAFFPQAGQAQVAEQRSELSGTRKQLATIVFAGLGGAILGLSTLSFYGRPQDHLSNIAIGFALGIIGGTIYTTYKVASKPYEAYDFATLDQEVRAQFYDEEFKRTELLAHTQRVPTIGYSWDF
jgi:hypothetical protein